MSLTRRAFIILGAGASLSACASIGFGTNVPSRHDDAAAADAGLDPRRHQRSAAHQWRPQAADLQRRSSRPRRGRRPTSWRSKDTLAHNLGVHAARARDRRPAIDGAVGENIAGGQQTPAAGDRGLAQFARPPRHAAQRQVRRVRPRRGAHVPAGRKVALRHLLVLHRRRPVRPGRRPAARRRDGCRHGGVTASRQRLSVRSPRRASP